MSDQQPQPQQQPQQQPQSPPDGEPIPREVVDQARREAMEARMRVREVEDENRRLSRQVEQSAESGKSDLEKAMGRAERAERKLAGMEVTLLRSEVAAAKEVPVELLAHITADDRTVHERFADQIREHATGIAEAAVEAARKEWETANPTRRRSSDTVASGTPVAEPQDMNQFIRAGFRR